MLVSVHVDPWAGNNLATRESSTYLSKGNFCHLFLTINIFTRKLNTELVRIYIFSFIF